LLLLQVIITCEILTIVYLIVYSQSESFDGSSTHGGSTVALGAKRTASTVTSLPQMCILCQEEQELTHTGRSLVLCAYVQRYTLGPKFTNNFRTIFGLTTILWQLADSQNIYNSLKTTF